MKKRKMFQEKTNMWKLFFIVLAERQEVTKNAVLSFFVA